MSKKRLIISTSPLLLLALIISVSITACGNTPDEKNPGIKGTSDSTVTESDVQETSAFPDGQAQSGKQTETDQSDAAQTDTPQTDAEQTDTPQTDTEQEEEQLMKMNIQIGENQLTATLVDNSSTQALLEMLSEGPVTIDMNDYAGMEKVGPFPKSLPRNDRQTSTGAGDLILYQGNSFVIYYDTNSWNFTRLGKIDNVKQQELIDILGSGSVTAVLSLPAD